jgi:threonine/homoserine/homoserine lactone efflux protein
MDLTLWLSFMVASLSLALMPGPDNIYVITESLTNGWKQGVSITTGLISGVIIHTTLVATGLSLLVFNYPAVYNSLKIAGFIYLLFLTYKTLKEEAIPVDEYGVAHEEPFFVLFKRGFLMNVLNPKVTLFFMVLLPQFVSTKGVSYSPMVQMMILGVTFMVVSFPVFATIAFVASRLRSILKSQNGSSFRYYLF